MRMPTIHRLPLFWKLVRSSAYLLKHDDIRLDLVKPVLKAFSNGCTQPIDVPGENTSGHGELQRERGYHAQLIPEEF